MNTFRYQSGERQPLPVTYWRRRFLALVVGLAILAVMAWAFSGVLAAGGASPAAGAGHRSPGGGAHTRGAAPGASGGGGASGSAAAPRASTSSMPAAASSPARPARPAPPGGPAPASPSPDPAQSAGSASSGLPPACKPGEVVLSLFASQDSYGRGQLPEFDVDVVSTAAQTCAFNVGPKFLALVITARGKRIWSSADCIAGQGSLLTDLARGVPTVLPLSWDRETSAPGCKAASRQVAAGSFAAAASDRGLASNSVTFTLG